IDLVRQLAREIAQRDLLLRSGRNGKRSAAADFVQRLPRFRRLGCLAHVNRVTKDAERRIDTFAVGVEAELAQIPDEDLLVIPTETNAGVLDRLAFFVRFGEQITARRLT